MNVYTHTQTDTTPKHNASGQSINAQNMSQVYKHTTKQSKQTGIEKASAVDFKTAAKRARKLLRSAMLWLMEGSYSFLTTDATESMTTSLALQVMMCSSSF